LSSTNTINSDNIIESPNAAYIIESSIPNMMDINTETTENIKFDTTDYDYEYEYTEAVTTTTHVKSGLSTIHVVTINICAVLFLTCVVVFTFKWYNTNTLGMHYRTAQ